MSAASPTSSPLWVTVRGASLGVLFGWLGWMLGVAVGAVFVAQVIGALGTSLAVLSVGWMLARHLPLPIERWRSYHLDDLEVTTIGPGHLVRHLPWTAVERLTQERRLVRLEAPGISVALPLRAVARSEAWNAILARVVPTLAGAMWARLEEGEEVRLRPGVDPRPDALLWWAWTPALVACAVGASGEAVVVLVMVERGIAWLRAHAAAVSLHRRCVSVRTGLRRLLVAWSRAEMVQAPDGVLISEHAGDCGLVSSALPNFWAALPVIETKVALGPGPEATVHFRVRLADGRLAVVGEIEPMA